MRLFVALGIVAVALLLLAAKVTRHHRRVVPPPEPEEAESETAADRAAEPRTSPHPREAWSGPTLRELLEKAQGPARIRGRARGPEGAAISVRALLPGKHERARRIGVENGEFEIPGLLFGHSYDLVFDGPSLRQTTLRSVTAPADDVEAVLEPRQVLRGAIGFPAGGACPYDSVELRGGEDEDSATVVGMEDDCRFELDVPDGPSRMILVAIGDGPHLELPIAIPPAGDPDPVCLNPPCLSHPPRDKGRLRVTFEGADHRDVSATVTADRHDLLSYTCFTNGDTCELEELPTGLPLRLSAEVDDCATATRTITLHAGDNDLALPCEPTKSLEAVVKDLDGDEVQEVEGEIHGEIRGGIADD
jgi:hypothetical protein